MSRQGQPNPTLGRGAGNDHDYAIHASLQALANIGRGIGLAGLDLEGDALAMAHGYEVDRFATADGDFVGNFVAARAKLIPQPSDPVPMLYTTVTI